MLAIRPIFALRPITMLANQPAIPPRTIHVRMPIWSLLLSRMIRTEGAAISPLQVVEERQLWAVSRRPPEGRRPVLVLALGEAELSLRRLERRRDHLGVRPFADAAHPEA